MAFMYAFVCLKAVLEAKRACVRWEVQTKNKKEKTTLENLFIFVVVRLFLLSIFVRVFIRICYMQHRIT